MEYTEKYTSFRKRLSIFRRLKGYSQANMAEKLDMTKAEYVNREIGRSVVSGNDLRKLYGLGADVDELLTDRKRQENSGTITSRVCELKDENAREYLKDIAAEHLLYIIKKRDEEPIGDTYNDYRLFESMQKYAKYDSDFGSVSVLKCVRDINEIKEQHVISDNLGISRFKYSRMERKIEYPDALALIRLYGIYGYSPSVYLDVYDSKLEMMDNIFDRLPESEQKKILDFMESLRHFL